jgi:hypothetical protein
MLVIVYANNKSYQQLTFDKLIMTAYCRCRISFGNVTNEQVRAVVERMLGLN